MKNRLLMTLWSAAVLLIAAAPQMASAGAYTSKFQNAGSEESVKSPEAPQEKPAKGPKARAKFDGRRHAWKDLSQEERTRLKAIHHRLRDNPEVAKAREAVKDADSREERMAARKHLREVWRSQLTADERSFMDQIKAKHPKIKGHGDQRMKKCPANKDD